MRQSGTWMTIWDDRILEIIRNEGPTPVGKLTERDGVRISQSSVSRRCQKLADHRLLIPIGNGVYDISDIGEAYLDEEYDAENETYLNGGSSRDGPSASGTTQP
ncbi:AsnC family transcriptional regulator [Natrinema thermotolerans DSM 11552]|nr:AsnC family transcriptional regulator [Natrinema thermotolerans DSM 11552]